jgi:hypothetical protein
VFSESLKLPKSRLVHLQYDVGQPWVKQLIELLPGWFPIQVNQGASPGHGSETFQVILSDLDVIVC